MFNMPRLLLTFLTCGFAFAAAHQTALAAAGDLYVVESKPGLFEYVIARYTTDGTRAEFASGLTATGPLAFDKQGNLFVGNLVTGEVMKISPAGTMTLFASGLGRVASLSFDAAGNLYVANTGQGRITDPDPADGTITKITPAGDKTLFASQLNHPASLAFDGLGNLFVTDALYHAILKITPDGVRSTFASGLDIPATIAFDRAGNLYETDSGSGKVLKFKPDGTMTTFASGFTQPAFLAVGDSANVLISDAYVNIYSVRPDGTRETFVGGTYGSMAFEPARGNALNLSSRLQVLTGDKTAISGFILTGTGPKEVLIRGMGPSLAAAAIEGTLANPTLELRDSSGTLIATNDDWKTIDGTDASQQAAIEATTIAPRNDLESAIIATLPSGNAAYSAVLRGKDGADGVGLVEVYDLTGGNGSTLANMSARGFVSESAPMISGFILGGNGATVLVRALGPSLAEFGVAGSVNDPRVDLYNSNGAAIGNNDSWNSSQTEAIENSGLAPKSETEAAMTTVLPAGAYTAVVTAPDSGVALLEVYHLQ